MLPDHLLPPLLSVRELVKLYGLQARSQLGQNFLFDSNVTDRIVRCIPSVAESVVVEVGPGPGSLTRSLLRSEAKRVIAVEKDNRFLPSLSMLADASRGRLEVIHGDILDVSRGSLVESVGNALGGGDTSNRVRLVGNLPFNVATPLIVLWLRMLSYRRGVFAPGRDIGMTLMFQKEVAQRLSAKPNTNERGRLAVLAQHLCHVSSVYDIPGTAFIPRPKVTASVVNFLPKDKPMQVDFDYLEFVVNLIFGQRRKLVRSTLKTLVPDPTELLHRLHMSELVRPEDMTTEQVVALTNLLASRGVLKTRSHNLTKD